MSKAEVVPGAGLLRSYEATGMVEDAGGGVINAASCRRRNCPPFVSRFSVMLREVPAAKGCITPLSAVRQPSLGLIRGRRAICVARVRRSSGGGGLFPS